MTTLNSWKMGLEIAILWYGIYMILLFVKGTRSEQLLKGLFIIGLIFILSRQFGLDAITWVMTRLLPISFIALVIVFQPELRRGLAQLGSFGIREENVSVVDEISHAVNGLSAKKQGALIVIERESGLKSYIESGTPLDARVTNLLLISIFTPQSPLHDGAVIIRSGRAAAAGCILPLPEDEKHPQKHFGMRHRAAIGISKETDAVCVVVSEETGAVSVAEGGKLTQDMSGGNLAKTLKGMLYNPIKRMPLAIKSKLVYGKRETS